MFPGNTPEEKDASKIGRDHRVVQNMHALQHHCAVKQIQDKQPAGPCGYNGR